ncbi:MAG: hypothetical protein LBL70_01040, partial [Treponema sp.]|nr:hypothetical protein [Treponema sp.]
MRCLKFILAACFLYCAGTVHSQILVEEDIDILMNGLEEFGNAMETMSSDEDFGPEYLEVWQSCFPELSSDYYFIQTDPDINKKELKNNLERFLAINSRPELQEAYQKMGWISNGHLKFHAILLGTYYLVALKTINDIKEEYPEDQYPEETARLNRWIDIFSVYK